MLMPLLKPSRMPLEPFSVAAIFTLRQYAPVGVGRDVPISTPRLRIGALFCSLFFQPCVIDATCAALCT